MSDTTYSIVITKAIDDIAVDDIRVDGYGLLREALDDIETMVEENGWLINGDEDE